MAPNEIREKIRNYILKDIIKDPNYDLQDDEKLISGGVIDSFTLVHLSVFIETNIRSVFIHHYFKNSEDIPDSEIVPLIERTLDRKNPREWPKSKLFAI